MTAQTAVKTHELKVWPEYYEAIFYGDKTFEVRKNDRDFKVGDTLTLMEFDPETQQYSGRKLHLEVSYVLPGGQFGIEQGYCVLGLRKRKSDTINLNKLREQFDQEAEKVADEIKLARWNASCS